MAITLIDVIALAILALMFIRGWAAGFIVMAGNLISFVLGVVVTMYVFSWLSNWHVLANWHIEHPVLGIVLFLALLGIIVRLLRLVVQLLNSLYKIVSILPFMGLFNRVLGAVVGTAEGVLLLVVVVYVVQNFVVAAGWLTFDTRMALESATSYGGIVALIARLPFLFPELAIWV